MRNLQRVMEMLPRVVPASSGDNSLLEQLYFATMRQWHNEVRRVTAVVGGFSVEHKSASQRGPVYTPFPAAEQAAAVAFLDTMAFHAPQWLVVPHITRRFEDAGLFHRITAMQAGVLKDLLSVARLNRLAEIAALADEVKMAHTPAALLRDVRRAIWSELERSNVIIDPYRQELQQSFLVIVRKHLQQLPDLPEARLSAEPLAPWESQAASSRLSAGERAVLRAELGALDEQLAAAILRATEPAVRAHLVLMREIIEGTNRS